MAIALVAHTKTAGGSSGGTSPGVDTTGANLIVFSISYFGSSGAAVFDNKGNTYTLLKTSGTVENNVNDLYYVLNPTVGSGHTFTVSAPGGNNFSVGHIEAFSGVATSSAVDGTPTGTASGTTTVQPGSQTPSQAGSLFVTGISDHSTSTLQSINSGFTITDQDFVVGGVNYGGAIAYLIQGSAAAVNPTWTVDAASSAGATMAVFKPAAGGSGADLAATPSAVATATAALTTQIKLAASAASVATATAALTTQIKLAATPSAVATATANLSGPAAALAASASAVAIATAALTTSIRLAANASAVASSTAALSTAIRLLADTLAQASATATLTAPSSVTSMVAAAQSTDTAILNFNAALAVYLNAVATAQSAFHAGHDRYKATLTDPVAHVIGNLASNPVTAAALGIPPSSPASLTLAVQHALDGLGGADAALDTQIGLLHTAIANYLNTASATQAAYRAANNYRSKATLEDPVAHLQGWMAHYSMIGTVLNLHPSNVPLASVHIND